MAPLITLYILAGCVAAAAVLFIVMIVLSALRPPQLPDISMMPPPLQRVIRAITPLPFATVQPVASASHVQAQPRPTYNVQAVAARVAATPIRSAAPATTPAHATNRSSPASPGFAPSPVGSAAAVTTSHAASRAVAPPSVAGPAFAPEVAPSVARVAPVASPRSAPSQQRVDLDPSQRTTSWPTYPEQRSRKLVRVVMGLLVLGVLAAGAAIAYPTLLDPLCDDYEWFGAEAAQIVRQHARAAHAVIAQFIQNL